MSASAILYLIVYAVSLINNPLSADWFCQNQVEIQCSRETCAATNQQEFTTMHLSFKNTGEYSVCAYTGCWSGTGKVVASEPFLVIWQKNANWYSQNRLGKNPQNVLIGFDRSDNVASLKVGGWAHPMNCTIRPPR